MRLKEFSGQSHPGPTLVVNEDAVFTDLSNNLFMVLDGFGGVGNGDVTVKELIDNLVKFYTRITVDPESTLPFYFSAKFLIEGNALINAMRYSHELLIKKNQPLSMSKRGGASAVIGAMAENILTIASVGNCFCYLYRDQNLEKLIVEDSMKLVADSPLEHIQSTVPSSGFGLWEDLHIKTTELRPRPGDLLIFATDGAVNNFHTEELRTLFGNQENNLNEKIRDLFSIANDRGNNDNQTALLVQF